MTAIITGCNGERHDPLSGVYHPGNGYRACNPQLMRFHRPDDWSPFGLGGVNTYAYCGGDPVNLADPSGHTSWQGISGIVSGVVGLALMPFTLGQSLTASVCVMAVFEALSGLTAIASGALESASPKASSVLGWFSLAAGILSSGAGRVLNVGILMGKLNRSMGKWLGDGLTFIRHIRRGERGGFGIPLSGEFRNARFLGFGHTRWNFTYEDSLPYGRRLNIVMSSVWNEGSLRVRNSVFFGDDASSFGPGQLRNMLEHNHRIDLSGYQIHRLIIGNSAIRRGSSHALGLRFYRSLDIPAPVVGVVGEWRGRGMVVNILEGLQGAGITDRRFAQETLDELSFRYSALPDSIIFEAENRENIRVFPQRFRISHPDYDRW